MTGHALHTLLLANGATLSIDVDGKLIVKPAGVSARYRAMIQGHLCFMLVCAAIAEVQRLVTAAQIVLTDIRPMVSITALNAACLSGEVETTRREAVAYVQAWRQWVQEKAA